MQTQLNSIQNQIQPVFLSVSYAIFPPALPLSLSMMTYQGGTTFEQIIHACLFSIVSASSCFTFRLTRLCVCKLQGWASAQGNETRDDKEETSSSPLCSGCDAQHCHKRAEAIRVSVTTGRQAGRQAFV